MVAEGAGDGDVLALDDGALDAAALALADGALDAATLALADGALDAALEGVDVVPPPPPQAASEAPTARPTSALKIRRSFNTRKPPKRSMQERTLR